MRSRIINTILGHMQEANTLCAKDNGDAEGGDLAFKNAVIFDQITRLEQTAGCRCEIITGINGMYQALSVNKKQYLCNRKGDGKE